MLTEIYIFLNSEFIFILDLCFYELKHRITYSKKINFNVRWNHEPIKFKQPLKVWKYY